MEKVIRRTICTKVARDFLSAIHTAVAAEEEEEKESMALTDTRIRLGRKPRRDADFFPVSDINGKLELVSGRVPTTAKDKIHPAPPR